MALSPFGRECDTIINKGWDNESQKLDKEGWMASNNVHYSSEMQLLCGVLKYTITLSPQNKASNK